MPTIFSARMMYAVSRRQKITHSRRGVRPPHEIELCRCGSEPADQQDARFRGTPGRARASAVPLCAPSPGRPAEAAAAGTGMLLAAKTTLLARGSRTARGALAEMAAAGTGMLLAGQRHAGRPRG